MHTQRTTRHLTVMLVVALLGAFVVAHGAGTRQGGSSTRSVAAAAQPSSGSGHSRFIQVGTAAEPITMVMAHPDFPGLLAGTLSMPEIVSSGTVARATSTAVVTGETAVSSDRAPPVA